MYSLTGGSLVTTAKLGPLARAFSCASVRGVLERLWTHLTLLWFADVTSGLFLLLLLLMLLLSGLQVR